MILNSRRFTTVLTGLVITACTTTETLDNRVLEPTIAQEAFEFTDCTTYAEHVAQSLDDESRSLIKSTDYDDLIQFHFGWGTGIRNASGLWAGNDELNRSCANLQGRDEIMHPDNVSMIVIEEVWKLLQGTDDT